jgi:hypothetical protein
VIRLIIAYTLLSACSAVALWLSKGGLAPLFKNSTTVMMPLATLCGALSFAFYNYVEGIIKDIPKAQDSSAINSGLRTKAIIALTDLKGEVIVNVVLVIALLSVNYILINLAAFLETKLLASQQETQIALLSLAGGGLFTSILVCVVQLKGFMTANKLRELMAIHGK